LFAVQDNYVPFMNLGTVHGTVRIWVHIGWGKEGSIRGSRV
jgi:hypothetical protein